MDDDRSLILQYVIVAGFVPCHFLPCEDKGLLMTIKSLRVTNKWLQCIFDYYCTTNL